MSAHPLVGNRVEVDERTARALELTGLDRKTVAARLAEIGELQTPTHRETEEFLVEVLVHALSEIPHSEAPWSWGEFHNGGLQPLYDISRAEDWPRGALWAVDLGLGDQPAATHPGETLTPRGALARNLTQATERLLGEVRKRLEAVGVSPYGAPATPPPQ